MIKLITITGAGIVGYAMLAHDPGIDRAIAGAIGAGIMLFASALIDHEGGEKKKG